jgi:hypothetical protein
MKLRLHSRKFLPLAANTIEDRLPLAPKIVYHGCTFGKRRDMGLFLKQQLGERFTASMCGDFQLDDLPDAGRQSRTHIGEHLLAFLPRAVRLLHLLSQHFNALLTLGNGDLMRCRTV